MQSSDSSHSAAPQAGRTSVESASVSSAAPSAEGSDRELMDAAAKAAGMTIAWDARGAYEVTEGVSGSESSWSPLTDDGDALRLAVKLSINICHGVYAEWHIVRGGTFIANREFAMEFETQADPAASTRRAIVRAAAAMGEQQ